MNLRDNTPVEGVDRILDLSIKLVREGWKLLDAANERPMPKEYLEQSAIDAIRGAATPDEGGIPHE